MKQPNDLEQSDTMSQRKCGCCGEQGHYNRKDTPCPNRDAVAIKAAELKASKKALRAKLRAVKLAEKEAAKAAKIKAREDAKAAKLKAKEAERERKRAAAALKKKLAPPKAGTGVKGRVTSVRNGYIISFSRYNSEPITEADIDERNAQLGIDPKICFWCKLREKQCGDHLFPACNTKHSCYSFSTALCIVPSCRRCNGRKGGKIIEEWVKELPDLGWNSDQIKTLLEWTAENKSKLVLQKSDVEYVEGQFPLINKFHAVLEDCARTKTDISKRINFDQAELAEENAALKAQVAALKAALAAK